MALVLTAIGIAAPTASGAGMFKCESETVTQRDYGALRSAAHRTAGKHVLDWARPTLCMNPGRGRAWIDAQGERQSDDSVLHPHVVCARDTGRWSCELGLQRTLATTLILSDREQEFSLQIPPQLPAQDARKLVVRAFLLAPSLRGEQYCHPDAPAPASLAPQQTQIDDDETAGLKESFSLHGGVIYVDIAEDDASTTVVVGNHELQFSRTPEDVEQKRLECWSEFIVVT